MPQFLCQSIALAISSGPGRAKRDPSPSGWRSTWRCRAVPVSSATRIRSGPGRWSWFIWTESNSFYGISKSARCSPRSGVIKLMQVKVLNSHIGPVLCAAVAALPICR